MHRAERPVAGADGVTTLDAAAIIGVIALAAVTICANLHYLFGIVT